MYTKKGVFWIGIVAIMTFFALTAFMPAVSAADVYPGGSIQAAINAAAPGDTITVRDGTYKENLVVNTSNIVIRSVNGSAVTIISSNETGKDVINITDQTNVTLHGFTIRDAHGMTQDVAGISMENATKCNISDTIVTNISATNYRAYGIYLYSSDNTTFSAKTAVANLTAYCAYGIWLESSSKLTSQSGTAHSTGAYIIACEDWPAVL